MGNNIGQSDPNQINKQVILDGSFFSPEKVKLIAEPNDDKKSTLKNEFFEGIHNLKRDNNYLKF